jgi:hypothetical protein
VIAAIMLAGCAGTHAESRGPANAEPQQVAPAESTNAATAVPADSDFPPAVLNGAVELHCTISSSANGHQVLHLTAGQGLEFDATVSPIVDGVVEARGPDRGGSYRFTSHLAAPGKASLSGIGDVDLESLETKVNVAMNRYRQPAGAGTELSFEAADMAARGIYVEFAGRARAADGERYAFRVTLGAPGAGSGGRVVPASNAELAPMTAKVVSIDAPATTVVSTLAATTTVQKLQ